MYDSKTGLKKRASSESRNENIEMAFYQSAEMTPLGLVPFMIVGETPNFRRSRFGARNES